MRGPDAGPRNSQSVDALVRGTRVLAIVALLALAGGIVSDVVGQSLWARQARLASLAASVIVVMLSVAVVNKLLERRRRKRCSTLAQFVMLALVGDAPLIWTGLLVQVGLPARTRLVLTRSTSTAGSREIRLDSPPPSAGRSPTMPFFVGFETRSPSSRRTLTRRSAGGQP